MNVAECCVKSGQHYKRRRESEGGGSRSRSGVGSVRVRSKDGKTSLGERRQKAWLCSPEW